MLLTISNIAENLEDHTQTEKELPKMIERPTVSQPLPLYEILPSTTSKDLTLVPLVCQRKEQSLTIQQV